MEGAPSVLSREEKYTLAKLKIKVWEGEYFVSHGSRPDKSALAAAPEDIKASYKTYRYYRKILESTRENSARLEGGECNKKTHEECPGGGKFFDSKCNQIIDTVSDERRSTSSFNSDASKIDVESVSSESVGDSCNVENVSPNCYSKDKIHEADENDTCIVSECKNLEKCVEVTTTVDKQNVNSETTETTTNSIVPVQSTSKDVWGKHLNKFSLSQSSLNKKSSNETSLYSQMAEKLRASSTGTIKTRTSLKRFSIGKVGKRASSAVDTTAVDSCSPAQTSKVNFEKMPVELEKCNKDCSNFDGDNSDELQAFSEKTDFTPTPPVLEPFSAEEEANLSTSDKGLLSSDAFSDAVEFSSKLTFRVRKLQDTKTSQSQAVSAISCITGEVAAEPHTIKTKTALNQGWLARCVGMDLESDKVQKEVVLPSDSWKMKLIDREWVEEEEFSEEQLQKASTSKSLVIKESFGKSVSNGIVTDISSSNKTVKNMTRQTKKDKHIEELNTSSNSCNAPSGVSEDPYEFTNELSSVKGSQSTDKVNQQNNGAKRKRGTASKKIVANEVEYHVREVSRKRTLRSSLKEKENLADTENLEEESEGKRQKIEDLAELEEKGIIQSSWPPPKKVRKAGKNAVKSRSRAKLVEKNLRTAESIVKVNHASRTRKPRKTAAYAKRVNSAASECSTVLPPKVGDTPQSNRLIKTNGASTCRKPVNSKPHEKNLVKQVEPEPLVQSDSKEKNNSSSVPFEEYDEIADIESRGSKITAGKSYLSKEEYFMKKVSSGAANNNFVRINLKKKVFVRGKKRMNAGKYKRQEWKKKQIMKSAENGNAGAVKSLTCFKCGDFGHWAKYCSGKKGDGLMPLESYSENESTFLSLEDAESMAMGIRPPSSCPSVVKVFEKSEKGGTEDGNQNDCSNVDNVPPLIGNELSEQKQEPLIGNEPSEQKQEQLIEKEPSEQIQESLMKNEPSEQTQEQITANFNEGNSDDDMFADIDESALEADHVKEVCMQDPQSADYHDSDVVRSLSEKPSSGDNLCYNRPVVEPLYSLNDDDDIGPTPSEVYEALQMFGYPSFRTGQENAIMRILSGLSTLLVLSTGSGKSLCYQLPAYLYAKHSNCITICVSPLVSLMEDQVTGLPKFLHAVCLHTNQNSTQRSFALNAIQSGKAQILLVSPEAIVACSSGGVLGTLLRDLPPVAFACLDEAHCVSEWSHNFRPSYLRVCQVLREKLGVRTILGLTATARHATALSIARHLLISDFNLGVIRGTSVPENLLLSASRDQNREQALITLLQGDRYSDCDSIIIYCTRRNECERIAVLIRTNLLDPSKVDVKSNQKRTRSVSFDAEAYHAGLSSHRRHMVQKNFMSGKLRVVVATVAFGMGIDKSDVRGIIHFNMPKNVECYVQEIGRAGRDGKIAHCHVFLDAQDGKDIQELKRHIFANSVDRHTIRKFLDKVLKPCVCVKVKNLNIDEKDKEIDGNGEGKQRMQEDTPSQVCVELQSSQAASCFTTQSSACFPGSSSFSLSPSSCPRHEIAVPISSLVEALDLPEENLDTLLCYLQLLEGDIIRRNSHVYASCTVSCYAGPRQLVAVSRKCPPLAVAIALERQKGMSFERSNRVNFPVVEIASRMGWDSKIVKRELKALEWDTTNLSNGGKVKKSGVMVEFSDLSFHLEARGDLTDDDKDQVLDAIFHRSKTQERDQLRQLNFIYQLLRTVSHGTILLCCDAVDMERCTKLREELRDYFSTESKSLSNVQIEEQVYVRPEVDRGIRSSVRNLLTTHVDQQWTGRAIARVFHGIGSPNFPTEVWGRVRRLWRSHLNTDFNILVSIATQEILRSR